MTRIHYCCFIVIAIAVVALFAASGFGQRDTAPTAPTVPDTESVVRIFKKGLETNAKNNPDLPDADLFGAALVSIAWEWFENCPDAAPEMFQVFERFVSQSTLPVRYQQWDIFLENLESALLHSRDAEHLRRNWQVRRKAVEAQRKALQAWAGNIVTELDGYAQTIQARDIQFLAGIPRFEKQDEVEILFDLFESDEVVEGDRKPLEDRINKIAKIIDGKLSQAVVQFERQIEEERKKDLPGSDAQFKPEKESETEGLMVWKKGKYQELLERLFPLVALKDNPAITFWNDRRHDVEDDGRFLERLVVAHQNAARLQKIRYNLWVVRVLSSNSSITNLSHIDTGLLESSVGVLYSQRESELITQHPGQRAGEIRTILLQNKVTLEAF